MPARELEPEQNLGWTAGLRNMLRKENAKWWSWKSLAVQLIIWTVIINIMVALGVFVIVHIPAPSNDPNANTVLNSSPAGILDMGLAMFFQVAGLAVLIGGVILAHDSILKERESGTAAWLLSKPVSRKAFVLSKLIANVVGLLVIIILVQAAIAYAQISIAYGGSVPLMPFLYGLGILSVYGLFYMVLSLALGAFTLSRGVALGLPIVMGIVGSVLLEVVKQLQYVTPWALGSISLAAARGAVLPDWAIFPIIATIVWTIVFAGAAIWRFEQIEL